MKRTRIVLMVMVLAWLPGCGEQSPPTPTGAPSNGESLPAWAGFFQSESQLHDFERVVKDYFDQRGAAVTVANGWVTPAQADHGERFGLTNLAKACVAAERGRWEAMVAEHFDEVLSQLASQAALQEQAKDLAWTRPRLAVRLYPDDAFDWSAPDAAFIARQDLPGTRTVLCVDLPEMAMTLEPDTAAPWGVSDDELFDQALQNIAAMPYAVEWHDFTPTTRAMTIGESFYASGMALQLEQVPGAVGAHGSLVGVPSRDLLVALPIEDVSVVTAIQKLIALIVQIEQESPGAVTARLYWRTPDGRLIDLPYEITETEMNFEPPDEFVDMLNNLSVATPDAP